MTRDQNGTASKKRTRKPKQSVLCAGCNKAIVPYESSKKPGDRAVDIRVGAVLSPSNGKRPIGRPRRKEEDGFISRERWGRMHLVCFVRSMEATDQFLAEFLEGV